MMNISDEAVENPVYVDDMYYDLFHGSYIKPDKMLEYPEDVEAVEAAMRTIEAFLESAEAEGAIEII